MQLPHDLDRQYQLETAQKILNSKAKFVIVCAPTGSGKTAYAAYAADQDHKIISVVRTKSLQQQYVTGYNFTSIYGKGNYECLEFGNQAELFDLPDKQAMTADLCTVEDDNYHLCKANCPYQIDKQKFIASQSGIMNYPKFLLDRRLVEDFFPDIIFLDEAHELTDIVTDFSGITFSWKSKRLKEYTDPIISKAPQPIALAKGRNWLEDLYSNLINQPAVHPKKGGDLYIYKWWERMKEKVDIVLASMDVEPHCWFIEADKYKFTCKPLTSQFHFVNLFNKAPKIVMMSATIQRQDIAALGIEDYEFIQVPNTVPAKMRPVYDLGGPKVTAKMTLDDQKDHAALVAKCFTDKPGWNGIIHVTSEKMAIQLADMMQIDNPMWLPEKGLGTEKSWSDWQEFNDQNEAAICISWQFFAGADMGDVAINISARVPYPYFGDEFEKARFNYNPRQALTRVGNTLEQQMGRTRRGFDNHYGSGAKKFCGIADSKWTRLRNMIQRDFLRSVVK